ncbi:hypothetical protein MKX34_02100 [Paenibacillus sp. FSL R5-0636]
MFRRTGLGSFYGIYTVDLFRRAGFGSFCGIYTVDLLLRAELHPI